ncbi:hypothetical protein NUW58_g8469 [Xylaria curta]|uniref:Uncharacterized protein n=1 Tax=Xylaria curta TaxID=42375 RepID=A0ACC1N824_9PEZI|nr:hypothetical protein NUW58_g8469 [Xylaria curta]
MDEDDDPEVEDDEMSAMQAMMGFGGFGSTKGQKVAGNNSGAVYKAKKTEYRQYMNRSGEPLIKTAEKSSSKNAASADVKNCQVPPVSDSETQMMLRRLRSEKPYNPFKSFPGSAFYSELREENTKLQEENERLREENERLHNENFEIEIEIRRMRRAALESKAAAQQAFEDALQTTNEEKMTLRAEKDKLTRVIRNVSAALSGPLP